MANVESFGSVSTRGAVYQPGSGNWDAKQTEPGHYDVTFDQELSSRPVVVISGIAASSSGAASGNTFVAYNISPAGFTVESLEAAVGAPEPVPGAFAFLALTA